jgi:hypothetical protein
VVVGGRHEPSQDDGLDVEPGADFHHHLAVDLRHIGIAVVHEHLERAHHPEAVTLPHRCYFEI